MRWVWSRVAAAIAACSGVVAGLLVNIDRGLREEQILGDVLANYFSLFTIVSSILCIGVLTAAARWTLRHPGSSPEPVGIAMAIAAVTGPVILLGIVFNVLLRGDPAPIAATDPPWVSFMDAWATETLHVVLPIYFLLDLLFAGRRRGLPWWSLAVIVSYPLDPHTAGYVSAFTYIGGILFAFLLLGAAIIGIGRARERHAAHQEASRPRIGGLPF